MATYNGRPGSTSTQAPPVVGELEAIFAELPDGDLLDRLRPNPRGMGRPGYSPKVVWRCYIAYYYLGLPSVSDLIRCLYDNPYIAQACGIWFPKAIPSQSTCSRFFARLSKPIIRTAVKEVLRDLSLKLRDALPGFGESVAIDSTDIKAWSNGAKNSGASDPDAGWIVKSATNGRRKAVWGYKVHMLADARYELPLAIDVTKGNVHDCKRATPLLAQAAYTWKNFHPRYVLADAAYSSEHIRHTIKKWYKAEPIIDSLAKTRFEEVPAI